MAGRTSFINIVDRIWYSLCLDNNYSKSALIRIRRFLTDPLWYSIIYDLMPYCQYRLSSSSYPSQIKKAVSIKGFTLLDECALLFSLASQVQEASIVEIGSYYGRSTVALALGALQGTHCSVYAIDSYEQSDSYLGNTFHSNSEQRFIRNITKSGTAEIVRLIKSKSGEAVRNWREPIGLLFIDGDHRYDAVKEDFENWKKHIIEGGFLVFHDALESRLGPNRVIAEILKGQEFRKISQTKGISLFTYRFAGIVVLQKTKPIE